MLPRNSAILPDQFTNFGELLKYLRRRAGLTQRELSIAVGYSDTQISRMEQNQRVPDQATLTAHFVPALNLEREPEWVAHLLKLAAEARLDEASVPHSSTPPTRDHNLPLQLTSFIGREKEIAQVKGLLAHLSPASSETGAQAKDHPRLISLTGPGGTGKTRLLLQVAFQVSGSLPDGVWLVELASLTDSGLVPQAVGTVLGIREGQETPLLALLIDYLRDKHLLLLLDNCEHVVDTCAQLSETLLQSCPHLHILASSREALGIAGETVFGVPSLSLPAPQHLTPDALLQYESVCLFIERARSILPGFQLTATNATAVAQVCRRLDGIPLALELAAAKVNVLRVEQIAARLNDRFRLLSGGSRTALPRHQTLRATMDWSYDLLRDDERLLLRRLSVFTGGWNLEAAEAVGGQDDILSYDILPLLGQLVNKSLVIVERKQGQEARYRLLETVRQYGWEKLSESGESEAARRRHLDYFVKQAEQAEIELTERDQLIWLKRLDAELDNIRAALEWSLESNIPAQTVEQGLRLGSTIWRYCLRQGYTNELVEKLLQLLTHPAAASRSLTRAKALRAASILMFWQNEFTRTSALAEESLAIVRKLGDQPGEAASLYVLGVTKWLQSNYTAAYPLFFESLARYRALQDKTGISEVLILLGDYFRRVDPIQTQAYLEEGLALCRERGDAIGMGGALDNLGELAVDQGDFAQAHLYLEESLAIQRSLGATGYADTLTALGELALREGDYRQARAYCQESLVMSQQAGETLTLSWTLNTLGFIDLGEGQTQQAHQHFAEALQRFGRADHKRGILWAVEGLASLAVWQGQVERAIHLYAWAEVAHHADDYPRPPIHQADVDRAVAALCAQLDQATFNAAWTEGQALTLEQAVAYALAELKQDP